MQFLAFHEKTHSYTTLLFFSWNETQKGIAFLRVRLLTAPNAVGEPLFMEWIQRLHGVCFALQDVHEVAFPLT